MNKERARGKGREAKKELKLALCVNQNSNFPPRRDCEGNSLARIEGLSAGIMEGWGQARPGATNSI